MFKVIEGVVSLNRYTTTLNFPRILTIAHVSSSQ